MKIEDFDALIKDGGIDTDGILKVRDALTELNTTIDTLNQDIQNKDIRIRDLQETNSKLYLRVTNTVSSDSDVHEVPSVEDIIKNWKVK